MIYSVTFHTKSPRRVHTFWFTDSHKALRFLESVKAHPKVTDYAVYQVDADNVETYDGTVENGRIEPVEI